LQKIGLAILALVVCLLVLEVAVRLLTDPSPDLLVRHPVVGKTYKPHFEDDVYVPEAGRKIHLRFNRDGVRGPDLPLERAEGVRRIAVVGDSFVVAVGVDEEQTLVRRLEDLLNDSHPVPRWEVQNFGVSSSSTGQEIVLFREIVARYRPDLVICAYSTLNDFTDNSSEMTTQSRIRFEIDEEGRLVQQPLSSGRASVIRWMQMHSRLYVWQKRANNIITHKMRAAVKPLSTGDWIYYTGDTEKMRRTWELNSRLLQLFNQEVEDRGSRFVLLVLPSAESVYDDLWASVLERAAELADRFDRAHRERRLEAIGRRDGIPVVLTADEFRRAAAGKELRDTGPSDWLFLNGMHHFNDRGHLLAAEILHRFLTEGEGRAVLDYLLREQ